MHPQISGQYDHITQVIFASMYATALTIAIGPVLYNLEGGPLAKLAVSFAFSLSYLLNYGIIQTALKQEIEWIELFNKTSEPHSTYYVHIIRYLRRVHQVSLDVTFFRSPIERKTEMEYLLTAFHCYMFTARRYRRNKTARFLRKNYYWRDYMGYRDWDMPTDAEEEERDLKVREWLGKILWANGNALRIYERVFEETDERGKELNKEISQLLVDLDDLMDVVREDVKVATVELEHRTMELLKKLLYLYSNEKEEETKKGWAAFKYFMSETNTPNTGQYLKVWEKALPDGTQRRMADIRDENLFDLNLDSHTALLWHEARKEIGYDREANQYEIISDLFSKSHPVFVCEINHRQVEFDSRRLCPLKLDSQIDNFGLFLTHFV